MWVFRFLANHVFFTMRVFLRTCFENFSFFPRISWLFIFLFVFPSFKITVFKHTLSIFFLTSSPIFLKRYDFCIILNIFHISCLKISCLEFFFFFFGDTCEYDAWIWVFAVLMRLWCGFCWLCVITFCLWLHNVLFVAHTHSMTWLWP